MSQMKEDWKFFDQVSDAMCIKDLTSPYTIVVSGMSKGRWAAFCIYDDDNHIERVVMATEDIMEQMAGSGKQRRPKGDFMNYADVAKANAGIFCFFDKAHMNEYQKGFESKFQQEGIDKWGRPDDESKPEDRRFVELACHLTKFKDLDLMDTARFGVFFRAHSHLDLGFVRDERSGEVKMIEAVPR